MSLPVPLRKIIFPLLLVLFCYITVAARQSVEMIQPDSIIRDTVFAPPPPQEKQDPRFFLRNIVVEGNKKTKTSVILRELFFQKGDSLLLPELVAKFELARQQLMNTTLFHEVIVALKSFEGYNVDVLIQVKERWYIFPLPYFKPVDRNLNQWIVEQKASLRRVNFGLKLMHNNTSGRNDKFQAWVIGGYTQQLLLKYSKPYFDRKMRWGVDFSMGIGNNKEINYATTDDKQTFLRQDNVLRKFTNASIEFIYRKAIRTRHRFGLGYVRESLADTVLQLNPGFFTGGRSVLSFPEFNYTMTYYDLDYIPYPTKGYAAEVVFNKKGFNKAINLWQLTAKGSANWPVSTKAFFSLNAFGTIKLPFDQPFYNRRLLGYNDAFLQGYEYYVVDGLAAAYLKAAFTRKVFGFNVNIPGTKKVLPQRVPFGVYARVFGNMGYVYNKPDPLNHLPNTVLVSGGFGIDITTIYDFTLKIDWSFNQLGQNGLFFHRKSIF